MKDLLFKTSFNKIYIIVMIIITLLVVGGYYSFAMFTVTKEKNNAISIVTGNLTYALEVDGTESNILTVDSGETKIFTVTLSNPNNRKARFNFYYVGSLPTNVKAGYKVEDGINTPPSAIGINLEMSGSSGSSNTYIIRVSNSSSSSITITLGVEVGLDYNDLSLPSNGHLFEEIKLETVADYVLDDQGPNGDIYDDGIDTFITGTDPNNYIWYSGKLWRAVSVNNEARTTKLVTQWNISTISYADDSSAFEGSYMEDWLNDTSIDGFLGNLRDYENFIVTDAVWDATEDATWKVEEGKIDSESITRPNGITTVTDAVGLLNLYEYVKSYTGTTRDIGYLRNRIMWWTLTPYSSSDVRYVDEYGFGAVGANPHNDLGVRPSINLKSSIKVVDGDGTIDNPYRLNGDNDTNLSGTYLKDRYSGEYITFGIGENQLYRIVSHENGIGTKITSTEPLKSNGTFVSSTFDSIEGNSNYSSRNTIGTFLNGNYLTSYVGNDYDNMIEGTTTWYLGNVISGDSYKLAKYTDETGNNLTSNVTESKIGLLRYGELMAGQFDRYDNNTRYWLLTPFGPVNVLLVNLYGSIIMSSDTILDTFSIKPAFNLKENVIITGGDGTKNNPFQIKLEE